jgi:hypothetical protein
MGIKKDEPKLLDEEKPTSTSKAHTLFLEINLEEPLGASLNDKGKPGQSVPPMTAVFAPDPSQLTGSTVDVILWFHGDKAVWSKKRGDKNLDLSGKSIQDYLQVDECKLREFILSQKKRQFLLVAPTLADRSSSGANGSHAPKTPGGWLGDQGEAEAYIDVVLKGVNAHMGTKLTGPKKIVLAAHSGGGHILGNMAGFSGMFDQNVEEVWCFDCSYWDNVKDWAQTGHAKRRLFVYSTGETLVPNKYFDASKPEGPGNRKMAHSGTGDTAQDILSLTQQKPAPVTTIEVLIEQYYGSLVKGQSTPNFVATYGIPPGKKHYESIEQYLPELIDTSKNLQ